MTSGTEEDAIEILLRDFYDKVDQHNERSDYSVNSCFAEAKAAIQSLLAEARKDELEWLLDAQDQELDLDNRPIGEAYHVINDGTEHLINERLKQSAAQGKE